MFHHDGRDYDVAASEAATKGRVKMEEIIHRGHESAKATIEAVRDKVVTDQIVRATAIELRTKAIGWDLALRGPGTVIELHAHAFGQLVENAGVPKKFCNDIGGLVEVDGNDPPVRWGKELIAHNVNTILGHRGNQRNLIRSENAKAMGFLSDSYRRLDSRPLLDAFIGASQKLGLLPIQGIHSDTKCRVRAVMPHVFEPVDNEVMIFGLEWGNSDYGDAGHVLNLWCMRVWCTNLAVTDKCLRQIHIGKRLADDIVYSDRTYKLDTMASVSALRDAVHDAISPKRVNGTLAAIKAASADEIKSANVVEAILKKHLALSKSDVEKCKTMFDGPDVVNLPPGNNLWRLSNAVSWLAQGQNVAADRKIELQNIAGSLIPKKADKTLAV